MPPRTYPSGAKKRQKKQKDEAYLRSVQGSIHKFLIKPSTGNPTESVRIDDEFDDLMGDENKQDAENVNREDENIDIEEDEDPGEEENEDVNDHENMNLDSENAEFAENQRILDIYDPGNWGKIESGFRIVMVEKNPAARQPIDFIFPKQKASGRHFSHSYYIKTLNNGKKQDRRWLVYQKP
ncbi:zinc finger MYM-type protein 5-like [Eutrema salsugineum]|uniref:zinc finger MYM-type protein 5-like n=1 Tax=Eutrema salsugineum TaxID=72664 RepID=UPI000CED19FD|nr:zinc finger MYM-type protein 5-like [Eutrema salsugineum]